MPNGSLSLGEYPAPTMRLACRRCKRRGRYRVGRLIGEHGKDVALWTCGTSSWSEDQQIHVTQFL